MEYSRNHTVSLLLESGLFDAEYYSNLYEISGKTKEELAGHYAVNFLKFPEAGPLFSGEYYLINNKDVANSGINPLEHYIMYGIQQSRKAISENKCIELFSNISSIYHNNLREVIPDGIKVRVLYTTAGNFFFQDIAEYVAKALEVLGWDAQAIADTDPREGEKGWFDLVMAPHEYMLIGAGYLWSRQRCRQAAYFNTEQWQTPWFASCFKYLRGSLRGVLDLNPTSVAAFDKIGIRSAFLPLLALEDTAFEQRRATISRSFSRRKYIAPLSYPDEIGERPYDLLFVANLNERRQQILAEMARYIAPYKAFLHAPIMTTPVRPGDGDMMGGRDFTQLALNSKILLNIHRDEIGYFEWHRLFLYGIANGTVVLTEPSFRPPLLEPGVHYLEASVEEMPGVITELLTTSSGNERLKTVNAACKALCARITLADLV